MASGVFARSTINRSIHLTKHAFSFVGRRSLFALDDNITYTVRSYSTREPTPRLKPNWSDRPQRKETILLDGCDFEHWLVVTDKLEGEPSREEIIDKYIRILSQVVGSEQDARMKIYSVSTRHQFAFGALVSEELSRKLKDSYLHAKNKDCGGEPFVKAVAYDPKFHEHWIRNSQSSNMKNRTLH